MSPAPAFESGFDSLSQYALEQIGMDPQFIADFENFEVMREHFDFTSVNRTVAQNVVDTAGKHATKKAFEEVGKVVDRSLEVIAATLGATGQWYGTAAAILGEEALDWAEKKFESYMGWDEEAPKKGHWILIDHGTRRRRMPTQDEWGRDPAHLQAEELFGLVNELAGKATLHRDQSVAYTISDPENGRIRAIDANHGTEVYPKLPSVIKPTPEMEATLNADSRMQRVIELAHHHKHGLERPIVEQVKARVGENITYDGQVYRVQPTSTFSKMVAESNGKRVELRWDDPSVEVAWNSGHLSTTFRTSPGAYVNSGFVTVGGFSTGSWAWYNAELFVVVAVEGKDRVKMWSARTGRSQEANFVDLDHVAGTENLPKIAKEFRAACVDGNRQKAIEFLPAKQYIGYTVQSPDNPRVQNVPQQRRPVKKRTSEPFKPLRDEFEYDTPALAQRFDKAQEEYALKSAEFRDQVPVFQGKQVEWSIPDDLMSVSDWDQPNEPPSVGANMVPVLGALALAAFVMTR